MLATIRIAARMLAKTPGLTVSAIALLAAGIGGGTLLFSAFEAVWLRPLPVRHPEQLVRMVPISESVARYAITLVRNTRNTEEGCPDFVKKYVNYGASVRAAQFIVLAAKARALSNKRYHVSYEDITSVVVPVLRHRVLLNFHAESDQVGADEILKQLVSQVEWPKEN